MESSLVQLLRGTAPSVAAASHPTRQLTGESLVVEVAVPHHALDRLAGDIGRNVPGSELLLDLRCRLRLGGERSNHEQSGAHAGKGSLDLRSARGVDLVTRGDAELGEDLWLDP